MIPDLSRPPAGHTLAQHQPALHPLRRPVRLLPPELGLVPAVGVAACGTQPTGSQRLLACIAPERQCQTGTEANMRQKAAGTYNEQSSVWIGAKVRI